MKKIISVLLVLTIIVLFTLTWYCGHKTEQLFTDQITAVNQLLPGQVEFRLKSYQGQLFSAKAETILTIRGKEPITLKHQIRHFVWGAEMVTTLAEPAATGSSLNRPQLTTHVNLWGASKSRLVLPQYSFQSDNRHLEVTGFSAGWDLNSDLSTGNFVCLMDHLNLKVADQTELNLVNLKITTQITDFQEVPLGTGELQLGKLLLAEDNEPALELRKIRYRGETTLIQERFSSTADLNCQQLLLAEESLDNIQLKLKLSGINAALLRSIQETGEQLQQQAVDPQSHPFSLQLQLLGLYTELLNSGITLTLEELSLFADSGKIKGKGALSLLEDAATKGSLFPTESVTANLHLDIDQSAFVVVYRLLNNLQSAKGKYQNRAVLAEQAEQIAGGLVQKGIFIRQDGNKFHVDFSWAEGQGEINGKPFLP